MKFLNIQHEVFLFLNETLLNTTKPRWNSALNLMNNVFRYFRF
jgi:hypothetical protein